VAAIPGVSGNLFEDSIFGISKRREIWGHLDNTKKMSALQRVEQKPILAPHLQRHGYQVVPRTGFLVGVLTIWAVARGFERY
jgi:hypothetical protein